MLGRGTRDTSGSSATYSIEDVDKLASAKVPIGNRVDGTLRLYDVQEQIFYVFFKTPGAQENVTKLAAELMEWKERNNQERSAKEWDTADGKLALYDNAQKLFRVKILSDIDNSHIKVFDIDSGLTYPHAHRNHLYKMPDNISKFAPEVVPVSIMEFNHGDYVMKGDCLSKAQVSIILKERTSGAAAWPAEKFDMTLKDGRSFPLTQTLKEHRQFKVTDRGEKGPLSCCIPEDPVCSSIAPPPSAPPAIMNGVERATDPSPSSTPGINHALLTCIVVGSVICAIIIVTFAAVYLYKRFGHVISERHRRHHHGHRRNRNDSPPISPGGSPSSSQKRDPPTLPISDIAPPPLTNENVITRLPQHNISKESPHHTQVNRSISPMVMENSASPNRAMTPLKTAEMATQTQTCSATRSAEPVHDDDASSNRAQPSDSRMAAGSSSDLSEVTLQPSLKSSRHSTRKSTAAPSLVSSFEIGKVVVSRPSLKYQEHRMTPSATAPRTTNANDYMTSSAPTMADDVIDSVDDDDEDEDSVTRSVEDCERVLAAYQPPRSSLPASATAHRTESHLSTSPDYSEYTDNRGSGVPNRASRPHLISLPTRSSHREEKRRNESEMGRKANDDFSHLSIPTDLLTPRSYSTQSSLHTAAARRESTVSWLADRTQSSMGRSMNEEEISL